MPDLMRSLAAALFLLSLFSATQAQNPDYASPEQAQERIRQLAAGLADGQRAVVEHDSLISTHAEAHALDPDWLRAIMMVEAVRRPDVAEGRVPPMGLEATKWVGLDGATVETFERTDENVRLAALLLRRILDRLPDEHHALAFVASLYDDLGTSVPTEYGNKVAVAFAQRWWENAAPSATPPADQP